MLIWNGTNVRINRWHTLSFHPNPTVSEEAWAEEIDRNLQEILNEDRARFDFSRCGSFLSGGVDSSYLLASSGVRDAFGIGFEEAEVSELPAAAAAARAMGARLHEVRVRAEEFFDVIPRFLRNLELPLADLCAPVFALGCERAAEKSSVCLSGEGADEFFGGYYVYARADELGREGALYCGCYAFAGSYTVLIVASVFGGLVLSLGTHAMGVNAITPYFGEFGAKTMIELRPIDLLPGEKESLIKALV
jgi:asparagine synthetase B (glutamine-hydrolysing)